MKKSDLKRPVIVGLFIFAGLVILIVGVFTIGSRERLFEKKFIVKCIFSDVGGLQPGNNVWLSGVKVGTVSKITFRETTEVEVSLNIEKMARSHVCKNAKAKISTDGFIGNKIVVIYGGSQQEGVAANGDYLQTEKSITTEEMLATLQENNKNLKDITSNFKKITGKIANGEGTLGELINDSSVAKDLSATLKNFKRTSVKTEEAISDIHDFTMRLNNEKGLVNKLVSDTVVFENIKSTAAQLKNATDQANLFSTKIQQAAGHLNEKEKPAGMLLNDEEVAKDLKAAIHNLKTSSRKLDEDLEALQHNFLLRGFFKKKKKTEASVDSSN